MNRFDDLSVPIERVKLFDLQSYLERAGWKRLASRNQKWQIFRLNDDATRSLELVLPADERFIDARSRIAQVVRSIAQIEERSIADVCIDLISTNTDSILVRLQVPNSAVSLPISDAARHVRAIKNLLLYSGCSELQARPHFEHPLPAAQGSLSGFEFCHTFRGSFGFEISSTVAKEQQTVDLFDAPINRRMVERIARGLLLLNLSVKKEDPSYLVESYDMAFNARMCDALAGIGLGGEVSFAIDIDWATSLVPNEDVAPFKSQFIGEVQTSMLKYVSEQLKIIKPQLDKIVGHVVNLHCATNPGEGNARRTIAVKLEHEKYGSIEVRMALGPQNYLMAIEAHSQGKELVAVGQLQRKGNVWSLEAIVSMELRSV
jgi:hypothetical protein